MTKRALLIAVICLASLVATAVHAERLIVSVSSHRVSITPYYSGEELVLFGTIERDASTPANRTNYDIVVTVTGPRTNLVTRRKARTFGVWVNVDSRQFENVPSYLAVMSNRPFAEIAPAEALRRLQIGLDNTILTQRVGSDLADVVRDDPFRTAFVRLKGEHGLYREAVNGVTFLSPSLFRAPIPLPGEVATGAYQIDVKVFSGGALVTRSQTAFEIVKVGFEQVVAEAARNNGLTYGLITTMMALLTGWFASVVFRKD
jgi:uncharacterized protein (TIGR02186 family)